MGTITNRSVRIFLSSTFRDFAAERNLLQSEVFPEIKHAMAKKGIDVTDVDLRWGVNESESQGGMALRICLDEIDKARPWKDGQVPKDPVARKTAEVITSRVFFVGMLGERYGWVPAEADNAYQDLLDDHGWLKPYQHQKSVTELEILHGVLENPDMAGHARFYFRDPNYAAAQREDFFRESEPERVAQLNDLKDRIRNSKFEVVENYRDPEAFAAQFKTDILAVLEEEFKDVTPPTPTEKEDMDHEAYARPRRRRGGLYLGGDGYQKWLDAAMAKGQRRLLIEGQSGGGKSALIANWLHDYRTNNPHDWVFEHYCGLGDDAADPVKLVTRLCQFIKAKTNFPDELKSDPQEILVSLRQWLFNAKFVAEKQNCRLVIALDAVNNLRGEFADMRWWPGDINDQLKAVTVVASCLPGAVMEAIKPMDSWQSLTVVPLEIETSRQLFIQYLDQYRKNPDADLLELIFDGDHAAGRAGMLLNPLFVRTLAEELRVLAPPPDLPEIPDSPGTHIKLWLRSHIERYLTCETVPDLFEMVLARIEAYLGADGVARMQSALASIWVSRAGLSESEVRGIVGRQLNLDNNDLPQNHWSVIRFNLGEGLMAVTNGRLKFSHDYLKSAVQSRYLDDGDKRVLHDQRVTVAEWFEAQPVTARTADEIPFQWDMAEEWERLRQALTKQEIISELLVYESIQFAPKNLTSLLGYWLNIESSLGIKIESEYQKAWESWFKQKPITEINFVNALANFIIFAGRLTDFGYNLAGYSIKLSESQFGAYHLETAKSIDVLINFLMGKGDETIGNLVTRQFRARFNDFEAELDSLKPFLNLSKKIKFDYAETESLLKRVLTIRESHCDKDDSLVAICLINLFKFYINEGKLDTAEDYIYRAYKVIEFNYNDNLPVFAAFLSCVSVLFLARGEGLESLNYQIKCCDLIYRLYGSDNINTLVANLNFAALLVGKGDYLKAENLFNYIILKLRNLLGPNHLMCMNALSHYANLLSIQKRYTEEASVLEICIKILELNDMSESLIAVKIKDQYTKCQNNIYWINSKPRLDQNRIHQSLELVELQNELQNIQGKLGLNHIDLVPYMYKIAQFYNFDGNFDKSLSILLQALSIIEINDSNKVNYIDLLLLLVDSYLYNGNKESSDKVLSSIFNIALTDPGQNYANYIEIICYLESYLNSSSILFEQNTISLNIFIDTLAKDKRFVEQNQPIFVSVVNLIVHKLFNIDNYKDALTYCRLSHELIKSQYGENHIETAKCQILLAKCLENLDHNLEAIKLIINSLKIYEHNFSENDSRILLTKRMYDRIVKKLKQL